MKVEKKHRNKEKYANCRSWLLVQCIEDVAICYISCSVLNSKKECLEAHMDEINGRSGQAITKYFLSKLPIYMVFCVGDKWVKCMPSPLEEQAFSFAMSIHLVGLSCQNLFRCDYMIFKCLKNIWTKILNWNVRPCECGILNILGFGLLWSFNISKRFRLYFWFQYCRTEDAVFEVHTLHVVDQALCRVRVAIEWCYFA
eukprot:c26993_g1_i1 orf=205-801(-)